MLSQINAFIILIALLFLFNKTTFSEQRIELNGVWSNIAKIFNTFQKECPTCIEFLNNITNINNKKYNTENKLPKKLETIKSIKKNEEKKSDNFDIINDWSKFNNFISTFNKECPTCTNFVNNFTNIESALYLSRLEAIKSTILQGLGLTKPPNIDRKQFSVPLPIRNGDILKKDKFNDEESDDEDSSGKPSNLVLVSTGTTCKKKENGYDIKFKIDIPWNVHNGELTEAKLWLYTDSETNFNKCNLHSSSCGTDYFNQVYIGANDFKDGWIQLDITSPFSNWLEYEDYCQEITVNCNDQITEFCRLADSNDTANRPFIVINAEPLPWAYRNRNKRNLNCVPNSTRCCREKLVVSFADIKWDNWIIHPQSYNAYYCKGKCDEVDSVTLGTSPYNSILNKLRMNTELKNKLPAFHSCCVPTRMSSLQVIYINGNGTLIQTSIQSASVEACGCA